MMPAKHESMKAGRDMRPVSITVWDIAVRLFHWSLVMAMAYELFVEPGTDAHEVIGYAILGLIGFRVLWGFAGTMHARFSNFVRGPSDTFSYILDILRGHPQRYLGHNPAGAAMVLALLFMTAFTGLTGWAMTTDALWGEEWIEELHEGVANLTIVLIGFHVLGVIVASVQHRESLVKAMITGRKTR